MHPSIKAMLNNPQTRALIGRALASKGRGGDTMVAHINPQEAAALKAQGGSGTVNPKTGLREFMPGEGSSGAGNNSVGSSGSHSSGGGSNGPGGNGDGGFSGAGAYNGQGRGFSGPSGGTMGGPYGGTLGGNTSGGAQSGSAAAYAPSGGLTINPGRALGGLIGSALGPVGSLLGGLAGGWASNKLGANINTGIGATDNRIGAGLGIGGSSGGGFFGGGGNSGGGMNGSPGATGAGSNGPGGSGSNPALAVGPAASAAGLQGYLAGIQNGTISPGTTFQAWLASRNTPTTPTTPTTPAPANSGISPLMSQAPMTADAFNGRFGSVPPWAMQQYQLGTQPTSFAVPRVGGGLLG